MSKESRLVNQTVHKDKDISKGVNIPNYSGINGVARKDSSAVSEFTAGSVIFVDSAKGFAQDNTNFFWDNTNKRLEIGTTGASATVPAVTFNGDENTGIGRAAADQLSLIAGAKEMIRCVETGTATTDQVIIGPAGVIGAAATPSLAFGDGDTGLYENADDRLYFAIAGGNYWRMTSTYFMANNANSAKIMTEQASATNPVFVTEADVDTGMGRHSADNLSLIAGGLEGVRVEDPADLAATETSLWLYDNDNGAIQQVTVGAADSGGAGFKVLRIPN